MGEMIDKDQEHLRLLTLFHYIFGGLGCLFACFPLLYVGMGIFILLGDFPQPPGGEPMPKALGWVVVAFGSFLTIIGWTVAGLFVAAGKFLSRRTNYTFCLIVAGIECLFIPHGTVLGVLTLIVLSRPSVKQLFEARPVVN